MIDDPLSLLSLGIWLMAAGMWPVGFLFGACSPCCGGCCCDRIGDYTSTFFGDNGEFYSWFATKSVFSLFQVTRGCGEQSPSPPTPINEPDRDSYAPFYRKPACVWTLCRCVSGSNVTCRARRGAPACDGETDNSEEGFIEYIENKIKACLGDPIPFEVENGDGCYLYHVQFYMWFSSLSPERKAELDAEFDRNVPRKLGICVSDMYDIYAIRLGNNDSECPVPPGD
jgi:hypothetical protein